MEKSKKVSMTDWKEKIVTLRISMVIILFLEYSLKRSFSFYILMSHFPLGIL